MLWPIYQFIESDQKGSVLWLENNGSEPLTLQIRVLAWMQENQKERYADQDNVVASPPFVTVASGTRQMVRLIRTTPSIPGKELAYRVIVDEVPSAEAKDNAQSGLRVQMRYLLPLFVQGEGLWTAQREDKDRDPDTAAKPALSWSVVTKDGKQWLSVYNQGQVHARMSNVFWGKSASDPSAISLAKGALGYVLPGKEMLFPIPRPLSVPENYHLFSQIADNTQPIAISHK